MADTPKSGGPTVVGSAPPTSPPDLPTTPRHTPVPGTMQLPRGGKIEDMAAPLQPTRAGGGEAPANAPPPMPEDWRYAIGEEIARGGMGRVVEATDSVLGRTVALKEALSMDRESVRRFQREMRITAKLEHPSIVPVHDAGTSPNGAPYYVMRKVSGRPLEDLVAQHAALEDRLALVPHIVAATHAIAHAHERGIVHRDIKPSNILVGEQGETTVIDWGLAKPVGEAEDAQHAVPRVAADDSLKTRAGIVFGTPGFMAPEQLRGAPADERCDVYALGATLYHLLARRPPHYTKDPDEMMKRAVAGPAEPLREAAPGVPPELATIVDKALAHDFQQRYQNASALAEDLQRFLTGQLVASHHYSRIERLVRFIRKNRALVGVSTAAVLAIAIGGTLAIRRVVDARDRAEAAQHMAEQERAQVIDSYQKLTLASARTKAEDDPTRAVAMLEQLPMASAWQKARAIGAAARLHGVAFGLEASPHTLSLELSRDGQRALTAGDDGVVRAIQLARREVKVVAQVKGAAKARFADAEEAIVVYRGAQLTIVYNGVARDVAVAAPIAQLDVSGPIAYWLDSAHSLWRIDVARGQPEKVEMPETIDAISASPDGRWIALAGADHLLVLDRTQPTLPPQELTVGVAHDLSWASDGVHMVALIDRDVVAFDMSTVAIVHRQYAADRYAVAWSHDQIFTITKQGVSIVTRFDPGARHINGDYELGLHEARGGTLVTASKLGAIAVISPDDDVIVHAPEPRLERIEASPRSPWVVGATDGRLFVWNLDSIEPRHFGDSTVAGAGFVSDDAIVVAFAENQPAQWIDLRSDAPKQLAPMPEGIHTLVAAPDGTRALAIDTAHHGRIVSPGAPAQDVGDDIELAAFAGDGRLVTASSAGALRVDSTPLVDRRAAPIALVVRGSHVAAAFADKVLWRTDLAGTHVSSIELPVAPPRAAVVMDVDGTVVYASGTEVRAWRSEGAIQTLQVFDKPVAALALVTHGRVVAITADGVASMVALDADAPRSPPLANVSARAAVSTAGLLVSTTTDGTLEAIDAPAGERWTLATPKGRTFSGVQLSPDGRRVLAITQSGVLVWTLALPDGPDATARWLLELTNARSPGPDGALAWQ